MDKRRVVAAMPGKLSGIDEDLISPRPLDSDSDDSLPLRETLKSAECQPGVAQHANVSSETATAFTRLPPEVIELILWLSDSNTFASLVLLNRQWNCVSQQAALYAHHLSRCPSYALAHDVITGSSRLNDLTWLKAKFAQEVRRNLFDAFVRPSETLVNLISTSTSSSAAFPRGEALRFVFSSHGQTLLALSSSRIFVVNLLSEPLAVTRELKTMRRPLSAAITNDGSLLAVLSSKHQANIYSLAKASVSHLQVIILENSPRTIALANEGSVLAAAYEGGVEVFSLAANALSTDRRAVRCEAVDSLSFSCDGSMLLGSSHNIEDSNTVVITAPFYTENDPDLTTSVLLSRMWTTQILFPQNSSTCSHAALLNSHCEGDTNWLFVYDRSLNTYRAVRADDTRTGVAYFLGPNPRRHSIASPHMLPSIDLAGELAVAGFSGLGLFLYGVPERVDNAPDMRHVMEREEMSARRLPLSLTSATGYREPLMAYSPPVSQTEAIDDDFLSGSVDWRQSLFVRSRQLATLEDAVGLIWVESLGKPRKHEIRRRLAVVAPGGVSEFAEELGEEIMPVDGGRILLLDFDYAPHMQEKRTITIEVGEKTPEMLPEQRGNLDVEVALLRRRSIREAVDESRRLSLSRSVTASFSPSARMSTHLEEAGSRGSISQPSSPVDGPTSTATMAAGGYHSHRGVARSRESLQRSATAAAINRARYPPRPPLDSVQGVSAGHVVHRRTNGRGGSAQESEVEELEPPPPYSRSPDRIFHDLERFQMQPRNFTEPLHRGNQPLMTPPRAMTTSGEISTQPASYSSNPRDPSDGTVRHQRRLSASTLDTWVQPSPAQSPRRRSEHFSKIQSRPSSVSPMSPPKSTGSQSMEPSIRSAANDLSPRLDITHPQRSPEEIAAHDASQPRALPVVRPPVPPANSGALPSLTGLDLQDRLNHPVPPRPSESTQDTSPTYIPTALQVGNRGPPTLIPPNSNSEPFSLALPTADQMANLNRRVSEIRRRPVPISTSGHHIGGGVSGQDFAPVPPSPPRAAWGAAGIPGSPPFNKASRSPQALSRNNSHGSQRSASTPNLLSPRPRNDRLETIDSVRSIHLQQARSRNRSQGNMDRPYLMHTLPATPQMTAATDPKPAKRKKHRRADKERVQGSRDGKKGRANRCIVM